MERRLHTRHRARTTVIIRSGNQHKTCTAVNLSANGVCIATEDMSLKKGSSAELAFAINLGKVTKIHRRTAIVTFVKNGQTGFMMEQFQARGNL